MNKTVRISLIFLTLTGSLLLPMMSNAWAYEGHRHHRHELRCDENPDMTLVTGMDNIDSKVLIAGGTDSD